jgi:hypothetical protein
MRRSFVLAALVGVLAAASALPAGAVTPVTFTLTAGARAISAPRGTVSLGSRLVPGA